MKIEWGRWERDTTEENIGKTVGGAWMRREGIAEFSPYDSASGPCRVTQKTSLSSGVVNPIAVLCGTAEFDVDEYENNNYSHMTFMPLA